MVDSANFPFSMVIFLVLSSYVVYISQLIRFAGVFSHVNEFKNRNKIMTAVGVSRLLKTVDTFQLSRGMVYSLNKGYHLCMLFNIIRTRATQNTFPGLI